MTDANLGCGPLTIKYLVFIFNLIFFLSGVILIAVGGVAQLFFSSYIQFFDESFETPAIGVIILGTIILFISFFGCCGAKRENVCMLRTFALFMGMLVVCEVAAGITVAVLRPDVEKLVKDNMEKTMEKYDNAPDLITNAWNDLQINYMCCGSHDFKDWSNTTYGRNVTGVPDSCCKTPGQDCGHDVFGAKGSDGVFTEGCYDALTASAMRNIGAIIGGAVALIILQMIGMWMSSCLVRAVKERYEVL